MKKIKELAIYYWSYIFVAFFLLVIAVYVMIKGENIHLTLIDMLDSYFSDYKMIIENGALWKSHVELPILGGMDSNYLISGIKVYTWLFLLFPPLHAFIVGWFLKIIVSIIGFVFLAKVAYKQIEHNLVVICGFLFGLTPAAPPLAFCTATLPILLALFVLLYKNHEDKWIYWGLIVYPIFSSFVFFGIFICGYILLFFIVDLVVTKKPKWKLIFSLLCLVFGYIVTELSLFSNVFLDKEPSIRQEFARDAISILEVLKEIVDVFVNGHYHCGSLHKFVVLPTCCIFLLYVNYRHIKDKDISVLIDSYNWIMGMIILNSLMYGLEKSITFKRIVELALPPLVGFNFSRAVWISPFFWYLAFMIALSNISKSYIRNILIIGAIGSVCLGHTYYNFIRLNLGYEILSIIEDKDDFDNGYRTYREFYSEALFNKIKEDINYQGEWSVAYAMYPAILEYNEIATLDGYSPYYSLDYKRKFEKLIKPELDTNNDFAIYFQHDARRAYVNCAEIGLAEKRIANSQTAVMNIDPAVFKEMGGKYIFSRVSISNSEDLGLMRIGVYSDNESPYDIYVYSID